MAVNQLWRGVIPAITTPFDDDLAIDRAFLARHAAWLVDSGCTGVVVCGSLGEGATLTADEKLQVLATCVESIGGTAFVGTAVSALSTAEGVRYAREAARSGADGLMVLPVYAYSTDTREMTSHVSAIIAATDLPCMLYNNPVSYKTDFVPEQIALLADKHPNLVAVKESSADVRRVTALRAEVGDRLTVSVGVDDLAVEGIAAGADGWIAGLVNALPRESVRLYDLAVAQRKAELEDLYRWFLPLLRMDTHPKLVQLIKLVQERCEMGSSRVRPPRLPLEGEELEWALRVIDDALGSRPAV